MKACCQMALGNMASQLLRAIRTFEANTSVICTAHETSPILHVRHARLLRSTTFPPSLAFTARIEGQCTSFYTAWACLGLLLEMNWHNASSLCQFISKSSPRHAQAVYKLVHAHLCTDLLFAVMCRVHCLEQYKGKQ